MNKQTFSLGQILSVTTGVLCCEDIGEMKRLMSFMLHGEGVYTTTMKYAAEEITPYLLEQHPQLAKVTKDDLVGREGFEARFKALTALYGNEFDCMPMHLEDHTSVNPIEDLVNRGFKPMVVNVDED